MRISSDLPFPIVSETSGNKSDMHLLEEDSWLRNTEVIYYLEERKSLWHLTMIYVDIANPFRFICRKIDTYHSEKKALTFAEILQRGIRKDSRGTLKTNYDVFHFCDN
ncbi:MAG: hypothetical protein DHS20C18_28010 [Saprospiraceae bacterium]|nr:MAG: hypothetical protein DHS20C18_28010 [Saprospiraceae bacterium]